MLDPLGQGLVVEVDGAVGVVVGGQVGLLLQGLGDRPRGMPSPRATPTARSSAARARSRWPAARRAAARPGMAWAAIQVAAPPSVDRASRSNHLAAASGWPRHSSRVPMVRAIPGTNTSFSAPSTSRRTGRMTSRPASAWPAWASTSASTLRVLPTRW